MRRAKEKRPFESWQQLEAVADRLGPVYGPMIVFAAATGLRPSELFALEQRDIDCALGVVYVRRAYANGRLKHTKTRLSTRAVPLQAVALAALDRLPPAQSSLLFPNAPRSVHRLPQLRTPPLEDSADRGRHRAASPSLRPPPHLRHVRIARRRVGVRGLTLHGLEHRDDRPPLRPPRPRQPRTRRLAAVRSRDRTGRGRCVDVATGPRKAAQSDRFQAPWEATTASGGRSVDGGTPNRRRVREEKELKSRNFTKPSNGLEPLTPSLPCLFEPFSLPSHLRAVATGCDRSALSEEGPLVKFSAG